MQVKTLLRDKYKWASFYDEDDLHGVLCISVPSCGILQRDTILARICYRHVSVCPSVCQSVISRYCIKTTGLVFGMDASFHLSHAVL